MYRKPTQIEQGGMPNKTGSEEEAEELGTRLEAAKNKELKAAAAG